MQGLVQKSGYIKPGGGAGHYAEYIGTRDGVELLNAGDQYLKYIAERPRSHGLFSNAESTNLDDTMKEVNNHPAPVWTPSGWGTTRRRAGGSSFWLTRRNWRRR